jgi:hypothetical protein
LYTNNNRNKETKKCNGQQTQEEEDACHRMDAPLTPKEEKRWIELETNEKKTNEEPVNQEQRERSVSKDETIDSLPENVKSIARSLRIAVEQMYLGLTKAKELILETARQLDEQHVEEQAKICKKIKDILRDEIHEGKISEGWIEECLPREYKRKYIRTESQQNHLSELIVSTKGNRIPQSDIDNKAPDTEAISSLFERQEDKSPSAGETSHASGDNQLKTNTDSSTVDNFAPYGDVNLLSHPSDKYIGQECTNCFELQDEVAQLREALHRISIATADQIPASEFEIIIPKDEYGMVKDAMDKSESAIFVKCDGSKKFALAVADVDKLK